MNRDQLLELKEWLQQDEIDDAEDLFDSVPTIIELIDYWLKNNQ